LPVIFIEIKNKAELTKLTYWTHWTRNRDSSGRLVTELRAGQPGFVSLQIEGCFLFATPSIPVLGPTQSPIKWVPETVFPMVKRPVR